MPSALYALATERLDQRAPELWRAETGSTEPASYKVNDGQTTIPLELEPYGTVFVVFRKPTKATSRTVPAQVETNLSTVEGAWTVSFQPDRGAPNSITLDDLSAWNENSDPGVKYFSGTGTYIKSIDLTKNGRAEPLVDELASAPLDLWAREHGYAKLHSNVMGM